MLHFHIKKYISLLNLKRQIVPAFLFLRDPKYDYKYDYDQSWARVPAGPSRDA